MENVIDCKNEVFLQGEVLNEPQFSHESFGQKFYTFDVRIPRLSGTYDVLPIISPKYLCDVYGIHENGKISLGGQFRSFNKVIDEIKSQLVLNVFLKDVYEYEDNKNSNVIELSGYICKQPIYRKTPFGREITDFMLAVNRKTGRADHLPCIAWGNNARLLSKLVVSNYISCLGRVQSRDYTKVLEDGTNVVKTAYEVSINDIITIK